MGPSLHLLSSVAQSSASHSGLLSILKGLGGDQGFKDL